MTTGIEPAPGGNFALARQLVRAGNALLVIFAVTVLLALLPPRLFNPTWQLQFNTILVNNGLLALLGVLLRGIATWVDPEDRDLQRGWARLRRLTKLVVLGYLLIIPLQLFALWRAVDASKQNASDQIQGAETRLERVRREVEASRSIDELDARLRRLPGAPPLTREQRALPLAEIKARFNRAAEQSQTRINASPTGPDPLRLQQGIKESVRVVISALALAIAFRTSASPRTRAPLQLDPEQEALFAEAGEQAPSAPVVPQGVPQEGLDETKLYP